MKLPMLHRRTSRADAEALEAWFGVAIAGSFPADAAGVARVRQAVLAAYRDATQTQTFAATMVSRHRPHRLLIVAAMVALLVGGSVGFVAAADGPGQPFYGLRLTIESLTLPPPGSTDRLDARLGMLQTRLRQAEDASSRGDRNAAAAAVGAVDTELAAILTEAAEGTDVPRELELGLAHAESVLTDLTQTAPAAALPGLQRALDRVSHARNQGPISPPQRSDSANPGGPARLPAPGSGSSKGNGSGNADGRRPTGTSPAPGVSAGGTSGGVEAPNGTTRANGAISDTTPGRSADPKGPDGAPGLAKPHLVPATK